MINLLGNISAIITCVTFMFFLIGRVYLFLNTKYQQDEIIIEEQLSEDELDKVEEFIDVGEEGDYIFSINSGCGIRKIKVYVNEDKDGLDKSKYKIKKVLNHILPRKKVYFRCKMQDFYSNLKLEIINSDYLKIKFEVSMSGKNGRLVKKDLSEKRTFRSLLYLLVQ